MPMDAVAAWLIPGIGLVSGLIANYVSLQNRALLAGVENRIIPGLNGVCIRRSECGLHNALIEERIEAIARR